MNKEEFKQALRDKGYSCTDKNGVPTVHSSDKKVIQAIKKLAKELSYEESFGVVFDDSVSIEDEDINPDPADETLESTGTEESQKAAGDEKTSKDNDTSDASDDSAIYNQPSLFDDMFDAFD